MFATFGDIVFEVLTAPESLESTYQWSYAEHRVVEDVPRFSGSAMGSRPSRSE